MTGGVIDIRAVPLPPPWARALQLLVGRQAVGASGAEAAAAAMLSALFGADRPTFGQVHRLTHEDLRLAAGQAGLGAEALPVTRLRELAELLSAVRPELPICDSCGNFPLSNSGGKIVSLPAESDCPFCFGGTLRQVAMRLRKVAWTDGRLVEPSMARDLRAVSGESLPLDDEGLAAWVGGEDAVHADLRRSLDEFGVPLYGWLAFINVSERRLRSPLDGAEAIRRPRSIGYLTRAQIASSVIAAEEYLKTREKLNVTRDNRFPFIAGGAEALPRLTVTGRNGPRTYVLEGLIGKGDGCDVYRAAWDNPNTERVVIKLCRGESPEAAKRLGREAANLERLADSPAEGTPFFVRLFPNVVQLGTSTAAYGSQRAALVLSAMHRLDWTIADVIREYPEGIDPKAMVWMWNRITLPLQWFRKVGVVHGAIVPEHVLLNTDYHTATLIGWGSAVFPRHGQLRDPATFVTDITMSARTMIAVLGGDPATGELPRSVPEPIGEFLVVHARYKDGPLIQGYDDAGQLAKAFGKVAEGVYGPRKFHVFEMPRPSR